MFCNIRKKYAHHKADRRYKGHPFFHKAVKFIEHITPRLFRMIFLQFTTKKCKGNGEMKKIAVKRETILCGLVSLLCRILFFNLRLEFFYIFGNLAA